MLSDEMVRTFTMWYPKNGSHPYTVFPRKRLTVLNKTVLNGHKKGEVSVKSELPLLFYLKTGHKPDAEEFYIIKNGGKTAVLFLFSLAHFVNEFVFKFDKLVRKVNGHSMGICKTSVLIPEGCQLTCAVFLYFVDGR